MKEEHEEDLVIKMEEDNVGEEEEEPVQIRTIAWRILNNPDLTEFFKSVFNRCDTNKDGFISMNELKQFLETQEEFSIPENVLESIYFKFDKNNDKLLDFEEFLEMVNNSTFKETFKNLANRVLRFVIVPQKNRKTIKLQRTITSTGKYEKEIKCNRNVVGMVVLSIIQIVCYYSNTAYLDPNDDFDKGPLGRALRFDPCKKKEVYRYFTYIFLHSDTMHLFGNVVIQIIIGMPLEMVHNWRIIVIYLTGAFGGCLAHSVFERPYALTGGSGGVFAFFTAHIAVVIMNWREMSHPAVHLLIFGMVVVIDVFYNIYIKVDNGISYVAHAGGAVVGLLFGVNILRNLMIHKRERIIWLSCLVMLGILLIVFVIFDVTLPMIRICPPDFNSICNCTDTISTKNYNDTLQSENYNRLSNALKL